MEDRNLIHMPLFNEKEFCIVTFGRSVTFPAHTYGPASRPYYLIHYIISGKGKFKVNQRTYDLKAGQGFLIEPNTQTVYTSDIEDPWTYVWVAFGGRQAGCLVKSLGLSQDNPIFSCSAENGKKIDDYISEMLKKNNFSMSDIYYRWGLFFKIVSIFADAQKGAMVKADVNIYVSNMMQYIHNHISENISVQDVADYVNLTRSYATTIFTKQVGMSPKEYIQNCRLTNARHLLESSSLSVLAVAYSCGFNKSESFVKAFNKKYGITPGKFRKQFQQSGRQLTGRS